VKYVANEKTIAYADSAAGGADSNHLVMNERRGGGDEFTSQAYR
jgi:hypothetical protein